MPDHEQDVQTILTAAIPGCATHLGNLVNRFVDHASKTPPASEQPTDKPRGLGLDVLAILDARRVLALEVKKVTHHVPRLGKVEDAQIAFLQRLEQHALFDSYMVFDRLPDLRFLALQSHVARNLAQLGGIAAVRPDSASIAIKGIGQFIGQQASGLTMLDVITRIVFEAPEVDPSIQGLVDVLVQHVPEINNCILWFFGDGYVEKLTLAEVRQALDDLAKVDQATGTTLIAAHEALRRLRNTKPAASSKAIQDAQNNYNKARTAYLDAVRAAVVTDDHDDEHAAEIEVGDRPKRRV
ncbi:hypothetical protein [Massilia sp. PWRC2]|uniref:hypothetical protein n=1 Tax=Massilia sp. PWRC2 TaxID=2804626 RepID=UPI003CED4C3E